MRLVTAIRRFALPSFVVTILCWMRYRCFVSPKSEVEYGPNLTIGRGSRISSFTKLKCTYGRLVIGSNTGVSTGCFISTAENGISIGDDCLISSNVSIIAGTYRYDDLNTPIRCQGQISKGVWIGNNVWIGANSVIADGAEIGDGCIISAGSVVTGKLPANSVAQGNPAKVIFTRR